jgi:hypothetical protein
MYLWLVQWICQIGMSVRSDLRGGPATPLPGAPRRHWNNRKCGAGKLRFSAREGTSPKIWVCAVQNVRQLSSRPENLKEYRFQGVPLLACLRRQTNGLPWAPTS